MFSNLCVGFYRMLIKIGEFLQPLLLLAIRLFWGANFVLSGLGKLMNIASVTGYFNELGIPNPAVAATMTGLFELVGGACLILGFGARLMSIPLIVIMVTAFATAHKEAFKSLGTDPQVILNQAPFLFLYAVLIIFSFGPGAISVDALVKKKLEKKV